MEETRGLRKDAQRNELGVLAAAERVFARDGVVASVEAVAAEAGVGVGTVYRRFGSKDALLDAVFRGRVEAVVAVIEKCAAAPTGREALEAVLRAYVGMQVENLAVRQILFTDADRAAAFLTERVEPLLTAVVERAKAEGAVRPDFAATDIPLLAHAVSRVAVDVPGLGPDLARRHLELLIKGLAPTPDPTPVPPPLPDARFADWLRAGARPGRAVGGSS